MLKNTLKHVTLSVMTTALLLGCQKEQPGISLEKVEIDKNPFPSTYKELDYPPVLIKDAIILTGTGERLDQYDILLQNGKIKALSQDIDTLPEGTRIISSNEDNPIWVTPGIIDVHSHLGNYASPEIESLSDGNEATAPVTANVWTEHSLWPQDPQFSLALQGGVTSMQILPGSANLIGGRSVTVKNVPSRTMQGMKFPQAPYGLKMACGENPKRVYGSRNQAPSTRMGNVAGYRAAWIKAQEYQQKWDNYYKKYEAGMTGIDNPAPTRDLELETLMGVLEGEILVHNHCYRADEMVVMIDIAKEFGYQVTAFHHAVESYKVADILAQNQVCSAMWADWWGFKLEAYDGIEENIAFVDQAGACAIVHSDSANGIQRLNQEAAKAMASGQRAGLDLNESKAIQWITLNAAKALGIDQYVGSLEVGKMADVVVWDQNPLSVYAKADYVFIDGALLFNRADDSCTPYSDFTLSLIRPDKSNKNNPCELPQ